MRLILGTAQLGMPYGIANTAGQPDPGAATAIVEAALAEGIDHFDTAQAYGDSEAALGAAFERLGVGGKVRIATKLNPAIDPRQPESITQAVERSFELLRAERLWCVMLHRAEWLTHWDGGLGEALERFRVNGRVERLGVSLGTVRDAGAALANPNMEVLQLPCNAWDRRAQEEGVLGAAKNLGILCCVRSIYLQGLLTMPPEAIARKLPAAAEAARRWHALAGEFEVSSAELAMRYALTLDAPLVVGAETPGQVTETAALARLAPLSPAQTAALREALNPLLSPPLVEPQRWPQG